MTKTNFRFKTLSALGALAAIALLNWGASAQDTAGESRTFPRAEKITDPNGYAPSLGIRTGIAGTEGDYDDSWNWGVDASFQPWIPLGTGVELSGYSTGATGGEPGLTRTTLLGKAMYNFGGMIPVIRYSYVGAGLGPVWDNVNNSSYISAGLAPLLGFDLPVSQMSQDLSRFTLGAVGSYLFVNNGRPDVLSVNGTAKYWF